MHWRQVDLRSEGEFVWILALLIGEDNSAGLKLVDISHILKGKGIGIIVNLPPVPIFYEAEDQLSENADALVPGLIIVLPIAIRVNYITHLYFL